MSRDGFTIRIFVPDGDPEGVRIVDRLTSTGLAIAFSRDHWPQIKTLQRRSRIWFELLFQQLVELLLNSSTYPEIKLSPEGVERLFGFEFAFRRGKVRNALHSADVLARC